MSSMAQLWCVWLARWSGILKLNIDQLAQVYLHLNLHLHLHLHLHWNNLLSNQLAHQKPQIGQSFAHEHPGGLAAT